MGNRVLGIDLGATNSAMAVLQGGKPEMLANNEGSRTMPSVVVEDATRLPDGEVKLLAEAMRQLPPGR